MDWFEILMKSVPVITDLVHIVEYAFKGESKSGSDKKKFVLKATKDILTSGESIATGGATNTWNKLDKVIPPLVDTVANVLYPPNK